MMKILVMFGISLLITVTVSASTGQSLFVFSVFGHYYLSGSCINKMQFRVRVYLLH